MEAETMRDYRQSPHWNPHGGEVVMIEGRQAQRGKSFRAPVCANVRRWGYCNYVPFRFLDNGEHRTYSAGKFNKLAKRQPAPPNGGAR